MGKIESAVQWMINTANDERHGYDQGHRWGPNYDCSSAVITAWETAGVPVKSNGAYDTRSMGSVFLNSGFTDVIGSVNFSNETGLARGDVLLIPGKHTAMYVGKGEIVQASINEFGEILGGQSGDQTYREFWVAPYDRTKGWTHVLRYTAENEGSVGTDYYFTKKQICLRDQRAPVGLLQEILKARGLYNDTIDQSYGNNTYNAVVKYQQDEKLTVDGVCGPATWNRLLSLERSGENYIAHNVFYGTMNSTSVLLAQEVLRANNFYNGALDWNFGDGTDAAVRAYQAADGKCGSVDGAVGPKTWARMLRR